MSRPYFVADQATVTVLKPVASSAFGSIARLTRLMENFFDCLIPRLV